MIKRKFGDRLRGRTDAAMKNEALCKMIPQVSRFGCPQNVDPNKFTLITSFSSERDHWMRAKCINIHHAQSRIYQLTDDYDGAKHSRKTSLCF
jgi:hypothetical protein